MAAFRVRAISREITAEVRRTMKAPAYGHPVHRELARGTGPCRECLGTFAVGQDERLLFTFNPFANSPHLAQPGPVFIHADECHAPPEHEYPVGLEDLPVVVEAHHTDGTIAPPHALGRNDQAATLSILLDTPLVSFLHLRHAEAGCFIARVDRA